jgi:hypothetical protein
MPHAKALDKKTLWRDITREQKRDASEKLVALRAEIRGARAKRKDAMRAASERCRSERLAARERARALRIRGLAELREAARLERESARNACMLSKGEAKSLNDVERRRAELVAEKKYQADLRRIERANVQRRREHRHATYIEKRAESDDEVLQNIAPEMHALFQRVKRGIKASPRMSRTESFLHYVENHPDEYLEAIDDKADALVRELESRQADRERRRGPTRLRSTAAPF